jgi:hypothetical protein
MSAEAADRLIAKLRDRFEASAALLTDTSTGAAALTTEEKPNG